LNSYEETFKKIDSLILFFYKLQKERMEYNEGRNTTNENNHNIVELDLRVSCSIFWKYEMILRVNRDEYIDPDINSYNDECCNHNKTVVFSRLERFLCDSMISHIHEDLSLNGDDEKIQQLCDISSKFHIHGHTTHSLLYRQSNAPHADHGGCIYICSHC
jgi:hypothetical protein